MAGDQHSWRAIIVMDKKFCTTLFTVFCELLLSMRLQYRISVLTFVCCTVEYSFSQNMFSSLHTLLIVDIE